MVFLVSKILESVIELGAMCRVLDDLKFWRKRDGNILYYSGNSVVVFKVFYHGKWYSMWCYARGSQRLKQIYGDSYYVEELFVEGGVQSGMWADVVLLEWVDGVPLGEAVREAALSGDKERLTIISHGFDVLAINLLKSDWAHGDLSGDNVIVARDGELHLIDFDAKYIPEFEGEQSIELGTAAFQSTYRTVKHYNASIDDYSIALISTALAALALNPTLYERYGSGEGILLNSQQIAQGEGQRILDVVVDRFCAEALAARYRIAKMLESDDVRCRGLLDALEFIYAQSDLQERPLEVDIFEGYCGYIDRDGNVIIPYIFSEAFEFSDSLAAVELDGEWFYIDRKGEVKIKCKGCKVVKSFHGSRARVLKGDRWCYIDKNGEFIL